MSKTISVTIPSPVEALEKLRVTHGAWRTRRDARKAKRRSALDKKIKQRVRKLAVAEEEASYKSS